MDKPWIKFYDDQVPEIVFPEIALPQVFDQTVVNKPNGSAVSAGEVIEFCKSKLAAFKVPKQVEFRDSLPKSNIGKVLRRMLKEKIANPKVVSSMN